MFTNLADEVDERIVEQVPDLSFKVFTIGGIDFRRDAQRQATRGGDLDGAIDALFASDASEKSQISAGSRMKREERRRQPVIDGACPPGNRQRLPLCV